MERVLERGNDLMEHRDAKEGTYNEDTNSCTANTCGDCPYCDLCGICHIEDAQDDWQFPWDSWDDHWEERLMYG